MRTATAVAKLRATKDGPVSETAIAEQVRFPIEAQAGELTIQFGCAASGQSVYLDVWTKMPAAVRSFLISLSNSDTLDLKRF